MTVDPVSLWFSFMRWNEVCVCVISEVPARVHPSQVDSCPSNDCQVTSIEHSLEPHSEGKSGNLELWQKRMWPRAHNLQYPNMVKLQRQCLPPPSCPGTHCQPPMGGTGACSNSGTIFFKAGPTKQWNCRNRLRNAPAWSTKGLG